MKDLVGLVKILDKGSVCDNNEYQVVRVYMFE